MVTILIDFLTKWTSFSTGKKKKKLPFYNRTSYTIVLRCMEMGEVLLFNFPVQISFSDTDDSWEMLLMNTM
jgi:hypothetical protein